MKTEPAIRHIPAEFEQLTSKIAGKPVKTYKVVSLFSGCGGMDLGFLGGFEFGGRYYDRLPFKISWANDISAPACATYCHNLCHDIHVGDIREAMESMPKSADVLLGGFPCQDVSVNGKGQAENGRRTILYRSMIEAIKRTRPKAFVAENVKGLLGHEAFFERMRDEFEALKGYDVSHRLYLAADYGVPQMRERIFIIGVRDRRSFRHPVPALARMTAREALADLESEPENPAINHIWSKAIASPDQGSRKLRGDAPSTTIRAEHHGNVQWHYSLPRRISLREAARLQSFPDGFHFPNGMRASEREIGNAVPPVLAWHIAKAVRECLAT